MNQKSVDRHRALARQWEHSGLYGLEHTDTSIWLDFVGKLGWIPAFIVGFTGSLRGPWWGVCNFLMVAVPTAACLIGSAFLRNRARWKRQAAVGHAVQSIGVLRLAVAMAFWQEAEAIDRAESDADRIAAAGGKRRPEHPRSTPEKARHTRRYLMFRTLHALCVLMLASMVVVCIFLIRVVGPVPVLIAFTFGMTCFQGVGLFASLAADAALETSFTPVAQAAQEDVDIQAALVVVKQDIAARANEQARLKREREARASGGQAAQGVHVIRLAESATGISRPARFSDLRILKQARAPSHRCGGRLA